MLVYRLKPRPFLSIPDRLMQSNDNPTYCPYGMSRVFGEFNKGLYNCLSYDSHSHFTQEKIDDFMSSLQLAEISSEQ